MTNNLFNSYAVAKLSYSYYLIGKLEIYLRTQIPITLSDYSIRKGYHEWYGAISLNSYGEITLKKACQNKDGLWRNQLDVAKYLPFGFWRHLLSNRHYGELWLSELHHLFPYLRNPKSLSSFRTVNKHLDSALRLRNNVAHYNFESLRNMEYSQEKIQIILEMTGTKYSARAN